MTAYDIIYFLTCLFLQKARAFMKMIRDNLNELVNSTREEMEEAVALAWQDLESERDDLRKLQHKTLQEFQVCKGQVKNQTTLLHTSVEKMTP